MASQPGKDGLRSGHRVPKLWFRGKAGHLDIGCWTANRIPTGHVSTLARGPQQQPRKRRRPQGKALSLQSSETPGVSDSLRS